MIYSSNSIYHLYIIKFRCKESRSYKLLGMYLDNDLQFNIHIDHLCKKLNSFNQVIYRLIDVLDLSAKFKLYYAYIYTMGLKFMVLP